MSFTEKDVSFLRQTFTLAQETRQAGRHPFAAIVVDAAGEVIAEAGNNSLPPAGDPTQHAELVAAGQAARALAARKDSQAALAGCTLYTNAEPCAMCAGAIYWTGIGRVVYGISEQQLLSITGNHPENPTLSLPCRQVFAAGQRVTDVVGPCLEDEAVLVHEGFWTAG